MSLASACGYTREYFFSLAARSDEDLEIERNDIRDILRTVTGSGEGGSTSDAVSSHSPLSITTQVLSRLLHSCNDTVTSSPNQLVSETVVHGFSSLAKPLNYLAKYNVRIGGNGDVENLLDLAIALLCRFSESAIAAFHQRRPVSELLPYARIVDITIASLSPMIAAWCHAYESRKSRPTCATASPSKLLCVVIEASILSIESLPELGAESTLGDSQYDIRGTMRGPGGEDHVGILAIMRIVNECRELTTAVVDAVVPYIPRLYKLLQNLKKTESERGPGVYHGIGVTPYSRRILLRTLCHLELDSQGRTGAALVLEELFHNSVESIAALGGRNANYFEWQTLAEMTECTFDIAAFCPSIVSTLFTDLHAKNTSCLEALVSSCIRGYQDILDAPSSTEAAVQVSSPLQRMWRNMR